MELKQHTWYKEKAEFLSEAYLYILNDDDVEINYILLSNNNYFLTETNNKETFESQTKNLIYCTEILFDDIPKKLRSEIPPTIIAQMRMKLLI